MPSSTVLEPDRPISSAVSPRVWVAVVGALLATLLALVAADLFQAPSVQIIRNAVCTANAGQVNCNSAGLGGITNAADALVSPVLVALFAICPIACLVGAGAVMFGNRRGVIIIASALGALVLAGAIKGIVA